jgi:hypothetical protein
MSRPLDDYVEVAERIERFYDKYPQGSLRCKEIRTVKIGDDDFLVYVAQAFRDPDDNAPAEGSAWEPVPGKTNFTRDSELMNAETSAWGRAIAALGFEVKRGIASRQEVMNRRDADGGGESTRPPAVSESPTSAQKGKITHLLNKNVAMRHHADLKAQATSKDDASALISRLMKVDAGERDVPALLKAYGIVPTSDVPDDPSA